MRKSLRLRLLLGAALWISAALVAAGLVIAGLLRDFVERTVDARLDGTAVAIISAVAFDAEDGRLEAGDMAVEPAYAQPLSGWYWQIANGREVLLRSPSLWNADFGAAVGNPGDRATLPALAGPEGETLRALTRDFTAPGGGDTLRVTVAAPASEIDEALTTILPPLLLSLAALGLGLIAAVLVQTGLGLKPLGELRRSLAGIRAGDTTHVPDAGYAELQPVIGELNGLIDHNRAVIERARTHVGNLAHGLKTPLAILANAAASNGQPAIEAEVKKMERLVQHHLKRARSAASRDVIGAATPLMAVLADLVFAMGKIHAARAIAVSVEGADGVVFAGERHDLEEMAGNLLDNACGWARASVTVTVAREGNDMVLRIADDGPGVPEADRDRALARGFRLDEGGQGSGLGLAIVRDLAALYGGGLALHQSAAGGLEVVLTLPAA